MKILLGKIATDPATINDFIDDEHDFIINEERERSSGERVVEDLSLQLSNITGEISKIFVDENPQTIFDVRVIEGDRDLFRGNTDNESIAVDVKQEKITLNAFSYNKLFWEMCAATPINKYGGTDTDYATFAELIYNELQASGRILDQLGIGVYIDPFYESRQIRWKPISRDIDYSTESFGLYKFLDPTTTVKELLDAISLYYHCEIFYDSVTHKVIIQKIDEPSTSEERNLDDVIMDSSKIEIRYLDRQKYDYLYIYYNITNPSPPYLIGGKPVKTGEMPLGGKLGNSGYYKWVVVFTTVDDAGTIISLGAESQECYTGNENDRTIWSFPLSIPGANGATKRQLFRAHKRGVAGELIWTKFYKVAEFTDATVTQYTDTAETPAYQPNDLVNGYETIPDGVTAKSKNIYMKYDEGTGSWTTTIEATEGATAPQGRIFNVTPELRFQVPQEDRKAPPQYAGKNYTAVNNFFGKESNLTRLQEQWKEIFISKRLIIAPVTGIDYKIGDPFYTSRPYFPNDFRMNKKMIVKRAAIDLIAKQSTLELLTK